MKLTVLAVRRERAGTLTRRTPGQSLGRVDAGVDAGKEG
jgi:hypothetical protein